ncbi:MAG: DUF99 family protein [Candidatus Bathyarchaeia archaeon]
MEPVRFRSIKKELRIVGIDDGKPLPPTQSRSNLVGVIFRGGSWLDGLLRATIKTDGMDSTEKIVKMLKGSNHYGQIRIIMLHGLTFAGLNVVNLKQLCRRVERPAIVVMKEKPDYNRIEEAAKRLHDGEVKLKLLRDAGEPLPVVTKAGVPPIYIQAQGIGVEDAEKIVKLSSTHNSLPEPIRVANLIASMLKPKSP